MAMLPQCVCIIKMLQGVGILKLTILWIAYVLKKFASFNQLSPERTEKVPAEGVAFQQRLWTRDLSGAH